MLSRVHTAVETKNSRTFKDRNYDFSSINTNFITKISATSHKTTDAPNNANDEQLTDWQQATDTSTQQFICKLHDFMNIISKQSNGAAITLSASSTIRQWISGHIQLRTDFRQYKPTTNIFDQSIATCKTYCNDLIRYQCSIMTTPVNTASTSSLLRMMFCFRYCSLCR